MPATVQTRRLPTTLPTPTPSFSGSLLNGLQSAYTFENAANLGADTSGNGNNLTKTGTVPQVTGNAFPGTKAVSWSDGGAFAPQGILAAVGVNAIPAASDFALAIWVKPATGSWNTTPYDMFVVGNINAGTNQYALNLQQSTKQFYFGVSGGGAGLANVFDGGSAVSLAGVWYFLYCEWDHTANKVGISRNNGPLVQATGPGTPFASPTIFSIGSNGAGAGFTADGATDALHTWTRKLAAAEITRCFNAGAGLE